MRKSNVVPVSSDPHYHDTFTLLQKYRDVVWNLELSVEKVRRNFKLEYGSSIEDFLDSVYMAGVDFKESGLEDHAQSIEQSHRMLKFLNAAVELLRTKHRQGEEYYWILYYSYLSPKEFQNYEDIVDQLRAHIPEISSRTFYRHKKDAIEALSSILWGYTSRDSLKMLNALLPNLD